MELVPFFVVEESAVSTGRDDGEPANKKIKIQPADQRSETSDSEAKLFTVIDIRDTRCVLLACLSYRPPDADYGWFLRSFRTYRAMISYLHTTIVPFLPVASNFLVELAKLDRKEDDDFNKFKTRPGAWLYRTFKNLPDQCDWGGVDPCSPHDMYRLADCYCIDDLRELSLAFIVRSLTVENVSFPSSTRIVQRLRFCLLVRVRTLRCPLGRARRRSRKNLGLLCQALGSCSLELFESSLN